MDLESKLKNKALVRFIDRMAIQYINEESLDTKSHIYGLVCENINTLEKENAIDYKVYMANTFYVNNGTQPKSRDC